MERRHPPRTAAALVVAKHRAFEARDWEALKAFFHAEGRYITVAGGTNPTNPEVTLLILRAAADDPFYEVSPDRVSAIGESAAMLSGYVRRRRLDGGWRTGPCWWMHTQRDGLMYRASWFGSPEAAIAAYDRHGITLGIV